MFIEHLLCDKCLAKNNKIKEMNKTQPVYSMFPKSRGERANEQIITIWNGDDSLKTFRVGHIPLPWGGWVWGGVTPGLRTPPLSGNVDKCCHIRTQDLYECSTGRSLLFVYEIHTFHQPSFTKIGIALHKQRNWTKVVLILLLMGKDIAKITWVLACFRHMAVKNNSKRKKKSVNPYIRGY